MTRNFPKEIQEAILKAAMDDPAMREEIRKSINTALKEGSLSTNDKYEILVWADRNGQKDIVDVLKGDPAIIAYRKLLALMEASRSGNTKLVKELIAAGADVNAANKDGETALMEASSFGHTESVQALIAAGADVNVANKDGETALMEASSFEHTESVKLLIAAGADVNVADKDGCTALIAASWDDGNAELIKALIAAGADVNVADKGGVTALMVASLSNVESVKLLIAAGADVNVADKGGKTALMRVPAYGNAEPAKALIAAGANVNVVDESGWTPLRRLVYGNPESVKLLIAAGAMVGDKELADAKEHGTKEIIDLLEEAARKQAKGKSASIAYDGDFKASEAPLAIPAKKGSDEGRFA